MNRRGRATRTRWARAAGAVAAAYVLLAALQLVLLPSQPAAAHAILQSSEPAAATAVATPVSKLRLVFSDRLIPGFAAATLTTATQTSVPLTVVVDNELMSADVPAPLSAATGEWLITYRIVSRDGHPVTGEIRFTVTPGTGRTPAATSAATAVPAPQPGGSAPAVSTPAPGSAPTSLLAYVVIAGVALAVLVIVVVSRRRHRS